MRKLPRRPNPASDIGALNTVVGQCLRKSRYTGKRAPIAILSADRIGRAKESDLGGAFLVSRIYGGTALPPLFNAPISEAEDCGRRVGYALEGGRVVAELMYADFMGRAGDESSTSFPVAIDVRRPSW